MVCESITRETKIFTRMGLKAAEDVRWNDEILQDSTIYSKVKYIKAKPIGTDAIYKLHVGKNYLRLSAAARVDIRRIRDDVVEHIVISCKDVRPGDFLFVPIPFCTGDVDQITIADCVFAAYVGRYGGFVPTCSSRDQISIPSEKSSEITEILSYLEGRGIDPEQSGNGSMTRIAWDRHHENLVFPATALRNCRMKRIPSVFLHLDCQKIRAFIKAFFGGDEEVSSDSIDLLNDIQYMCYKIQKPSRMSYHRNNAKLSLFAEKFFNVSDDRIYMLVTDVERDNIDTVMYAFGTTDTWSETKLVTALGVCRTRIDTDISIG